MRVRRPRQQRDTLGTSPEDAPPETCEAR
jgi:hypothetical protein